MISGAGGMAKRICNPSAAIATSKANTARPRDNGFRLKPSLSLSKRFIATKTPAPAKDSPPSRRMGRARVGAVRFSSPQVLGILSLKLGFDTRIMLAPEIGEVLRNLHWLHAWSEDVNQHRHAAHGDARGLGYVVKFL